MTNLSFDVIIIGGGPSGSAAAYTLARQGISVCLIDKSLFPRDKLCGGLLTLRSKKLFEQIFEQNWADVVTYQSRGVRFYHRNRLLNKVEDYTEIAFTNRLLFDDYLLKKAEVAGTVLHLGQAVTSINTEQNSVRLSDGSRFQYRCLIGCDGVYSTVAQELYGKSFDKDNTCFALEISLPLDLVDYQTDTPEIYFGYTKWGYGWIFPGNDHLTVGLAGLQGKNPGLNFAFTRFLQDRFGYVPDIKFKGHFLPFGSYQINPGKDNILLCGDAAGLVDPITGEGISYALQSGNLAAKAVSKALKYNQPNLAMTYYRKQYRKMTNDIAIANLLKHLIFPPVSNILFLKALPRTNSIPRAYLDLLSGGISYTRFARFILTKLLTAPFYSR